MIENEISTRVIGMAIEVHSQLGPGLLEKSYQHCLSHELKKSGLFVEEEKAMPLIFKDVRLDCGYRIDLLVENKLVVEIKSISEVNDIHFAQVLTYLRMGNYKLGLLLNFNVLSMKNGVRRVANHL
ncbi:GxxExxY protein [Daejeonella sp.]|uniref:GxxExxY protein n=1 Tax=Daejeonella sp. TaxID=2805397 RepID=UPI0030C45C37